MGCGGEAYSTAPWLQNMAHEAQTVHILRQEYNQNNGYRQHHTTMTRTPKILEDQAHKQTKRTPEKHTAGPNACHLHVACMRRSC